MIWVIWIGNRLDWYGCIQPIADSVKVNKRLIQGVADQHHFPGKIWYAKKITLGNGQCPLDQDAEKDLRQWKGLNIGFPTGPMVTSPLLQRPFAPDLAITRPQGLAFHADM